MYGKLEFSKDEIWKIIKLNEKYEINVSNDMVTFLQSILNNGRIINKETLKNIIDIILTDISSILTYELKKKKRIRVKITEYDILNYLELSENSHYLYNLGF